MWHLEKNRRAMPWKSLKDPYKIWLSEIILQQTRVEQGLSYYQKFIKKYPVIQDLAAAPDEEVFKLWEGLGYYSRCKNLLHTARFITFENEGKFPEDYGEILKLKGVGPYTAAAIASFAFNQPHAVVDGNVYRVLSRYFGEDLPIDLPEGKKWFQTLAEKLLDKNAPASYNQAIMDFGATICTPKMPACVTCYLQKKCVAYNKNLVQYLPVKSKKIKKEDLYFYYIMLQCKNNLLLKKRVEKNIWQNLYEFLLVKREQPLSQPEESADYLFRTYSSAKFKIISISKPYLQLLTHKKIKAVFLQIEVNKKIEVPGHFWVDKNSTRNYPFPGIINKFLQAEENYRL